MKTPVKLIFIALPVLMVGAVTWHLQNPSRIVPGEEPCPSRLITQPSATEPAQPTRGADGACIPPHFDTQNNTVGTQVTELHLVQFDGDRTQWTLEAPSAHNEGEQHVLIQEPDLTIYKKDGQRASVTALEGFVDNHSQAMVFTGNVVAQNGTQRLSTEVLRFDPKEQILHTDQEFLLVNEGMHLEGIGLTLYQETKKLVVQNRVKVRYSTVQEEIIREKATAQPQHS